MSRYLALLAVLTVLSISGCVAPPGPRYSEVASTIPPVPQNQARIYFYRDYEPYESLSRPYIYLNQEIAGISIPGGVFYRDVAPGTYLVSVDSYGVYWNQFKTATLGPGDIRYAKIESLRSWVEYKRFNPDTFVVALIEAPQALPAMRYAQREGTGL
jgi:hypothetical protein